MQLAAVQVVPVATRPLSIVDDSNACDFTEDDGHSGSGVGRIRNLQPALVGGHWQGFLHPDELLAIEGVVALRAGRGGDGSASQGTLELRSHGLVGCRIGRDKDDSLLGSCAVVDEERHLGIGRCNLGGRGGLGAYCADGVELGLRFRGLQCQGHVAVVGHIFARSNRDGESFDGRCQACGSSLAVAMRGVANHLIPYEVGARCCLLGDGCRPARGGSGLVVSAQSVLEGAAGSFATSNQSLCTTRGIYFSNTCRCGGQCGCRIILYLQLYVVVWHRGQRPCLAVCRGQIDVQCGSDGHFYGSLSHVVVVTVAHYFIMDGIGALVCAGRNIRAPCRTVERVLHRANASSH